MVRGLEPLHEPGEGVDEPLGLPVGLVEDKADEGEEPDVRLGVAVRLPHLPLVLLLELPPPLLHHRGIEVQLPSPHESLIVAVSVPVC